MFIKRLRIRAAASWRQFRQFFGDHLAQLAPFVLLAMIVLIYVAGFYVLAMPIWNHRLTLATGLLGTRGEQDCVKLAKVIQEHSPDDRDVRNTNSQSYYYVRNFTIETLPSFGSVQNARSLHDGRSDLAVVQDGLIGNDEFEEAPAPGSASRRDGEIRSLYHLGQSYLYVVIRKEDRAKYASIADFTPRTRVYTGQTGSAARVVSERVLQFYRSKAIQPPADLQHRPAPRPERSPCEVIASLAGEVALPPEDEVDVVFILGNPHVKPDVAPPGGPSAPAASGSKGEGALASCQEDVVRYIAEHPDRLEVLSLDRAEGLAWTYHFLDAVTLAKGSYPTAEGFPPATIRTVATNTILACRADLPRHQAYQIVRTLGHHQNKLTREYGDPTPISGVNPQDSFKYRLHDGALPYYRQAPDGDYVTLAHVLVMIGVCFTAAVYFNNTSIKRRVDILARDIEAVFEVQGLAPPAESDDSRETPDTDDSGSKARWAINRLHALKRKALGNYRAGVIDKTGYDRIKECVDLAVADLRPLEESAR